MAEYQNKMMTTKNGKIEVLILTDELKRGGDELVMEKAAYGTVKEKERQKRLVDLMNGKVK